MSTETLATPTASDLAPVAEDMSAYVIAGAVTSEQQSLLSVIALSPSPLAPATLYVIPVPRYVPVTLFPESSVAVVPLLCGANPGFLGDAGNTEAAELLRQRELRAKRWRGCQASPRPKCFQALNGPSRPLLRASYRSDLI